MFIYLKAAANERSQKNTCWRNSRQTGKQSALGPRGLGFSWFRPNMVQSGLWHVGVLKGDPLFGDPGMKS